MPIGVSKIFDFFEHNQSGIIGRYEITLPAFSVLRRSLRQIVLMLRDSDNQEAQTIASEIRTLLSEWLTVPVRFDDEIQNSLSELMGPADSVQRRWGSDIRALYDSACHAAHDLAKSDNPVREKILNVVREMRSKKETFKIYCHRRAKQYFESILSSSGEDQFSEGTFLHSVRDYRETEIFDVLVKIGPLRSRGWGSVTDSILTAPHFKSLVQIVWSGCSDEQDFGYDPVTSSELAKKENNLTSRGITTHRGPISWSTEVIRSGDDGGVSGNPLEEDELRIFEEMNRSTEKRRAILVQIDELHGILFPSYSKILSFDPGAAPNELVDMRILGETLREGMFLIRPRVYHVNLGGVQARHGAYSNIWKGKLKELYESNQHGLISRLRIAGLNLVNLASTIRQWCRPPSTVIHAPQQRRHFEILITVLNIDNSKLSQDSTPFWRLAWNEVRQSRGEAIQAGFQENEIVEEQLLVILKKLLPEIRENVLGAESFSLPIPEGCGIYGDFLIHKVHGIEDGFSVPETDLKFVRELRTIDQWRD